MEFVSATSANGDQPQLVSGRSNKQADSSQYNRDLNTITIDKKVSIRSVLSNVFLKITKNKPNDRQNLLNWLFLLVYSNPIVKSRLSLFAFLFVFVIKSSLFLTKIQRKAIVNM